MFDADDVLSGGIANDDHSLVDLERLGEQLSSEITDRDQSVGIEFPVFCRGGGSFLGAEQALAQLDPLSEQVLGPGPEPFCTGLDPAPADQHEQDQTQTQDQP